MAKPINRKSSISGWTLTKPRRKVRHEKRSGRLAFVRHGRGTLALLVTAKQLPMVREDYSANSVFEQQIMAHKRGEQTNRTDERWRSILRWE